MIRLLFLVAGYAFGCIQTSFILGKKQGVDIREHGSGNAGTTNALRVMGKKFAALVFIGDMGKLFVAVLLMLLLFKGRGEELRLMIKLYTGMGVVLGHIFPFYMNFKGGKGVASTGALILILDWRMALLGVVLFFGIALTTKLVSLASCVTGVCSWILFTILILGGHIAAGALFPWEAILLFGLMVLLVIVRHSENIKRLIEGRENKLKF